ncbi:MAG: RNA polymerase [Flavobacteriales bacterium]|nr:MAG: RNA polymerase [Flavobacteriales bacterium]
MIETDKIFLSAIEKNKDSLFRLCLAYSSNQEDAQDLYQEVLINIWKSLPGFKEKSKISTWMYRIALNNCLRESHKRTKKLKLFKNIKYVDIENLEVNMDEDNSSRLTMLYNCIKKLNDSDKSIVMLFLEDMSYKEISMVTGLSENHIAVKMKRIRTKLFNCFKS